MIGSPCKRECKLSSNSMCLACFRTLDEVRMWSGMSVSDRVAIMTDLLKQRFTHRCPKCQVNTYCAMADGKSASACWCFSVPKEFDPVTDFVYNDCLCRKCLSEEK